MDGAEVKAAVLEQVRAASGAGGPVVAIDLPLGATGFIADLAILDDEFIGIVVADASDAPAALAERLDATARFFERVVLIAPPGRLPDPGSDMLAGATVWTWDDGRLAEHDPGTGNRVGLNARFDLLRIDERRYFLGELVEVDGVEPRGPNIVPPARTRALFGMVFTARYGRTSAGFWAAVADRAIEPGDLGFMRRAADPTHDAAYPVVERRRARG